MDIIQVTTKAELKQFIHFPYSFYKNDPLWVPPLLVELKGQFNKKKNPLLDHCEYALFLLECNHQVIGRIAAFIDHLAVDFWKEPIGLFGYYECIDDRDASELLLNTALNWLKQHGMKSMRGPWSFVSQEWGLVIDGFSPSPVIMAPYNPPYYINHFENFGLAKAKDLLCYYISGREGYVVPSRILDLTNDVAKRFEVTVRRVDMKNYDKEVQTIIELSNNSLIGNWGYSPLTKAEAEAVARDLKSIIQTKGVLFAEDKYGKAIGFVIAIPDINIILKNMKGRLFPFGWLKLLWGLPRLTNFRLFGL